MPWEGNTFKMNIPIFIIIITLYAVLFFWTWNNTIEFEDTKQRIKYIIVGLVIILIITSLIFYISKIGIQYPNKEILKKVRQITIFLFIPINGFFIMPHIAKLISNIKKEEISDEKLKRKIKIISIVFILLIAVEIFYIRDFQSGIINYITKINK